MMDSENERSERKRFIPKMRKVEKKLLYGRVSPPSFSTGLFIIGSRPLLLG